MNSRFKDARSSMFVAARCRGTLWEPVNSYSRIELGSCFGEGQHRRSGEEDDWVNRIRAIWSGIGTKRVGWMCEEDVVDPDMHKEV